MLTQEPASMPSGASNAAGTTALRLGLRANLSQFLLLVAVNALVGGMLGQERTVVPLLARIVFHLPGYTAALTYIVAFGATKAIANFFAGTLADRRGRKPVLVAGWLIALPVPALLIWSPSWAWIVGANVLLGVNQGLTWSTTVNMKIDLVGPALRGMAMGFNEASGYLALAVTAMVTGAIAAHAGLRPDPFLLGAAYLALALGLSTLAVRETHGHARLEATRHADSGHHAALTTRQVAWLTSAGDRALSAASQAGLVNNLNDTLAWGIFPLLFAAHGLSVARIGVLAALYPAVWGCGQLLTGWWSDRVGRKHLITAGMLIQAAAIALVAAGTTFPGHHRRHLDGRRPHRRLRNRRRGADVRNPRRCHPIVSSGTRQAGEASLYRLTGFGTPAPSRSGSRSPNSQASWPTPPAASRRYSEHRARQAHLAAGRTPSTSTPKSPPASTPANNIADARFNDYGPLLRLGRTGQALHLLLECRQAFSATGDIQMRATRRPPSGHSRISSPRRGRWRRRQGAFGMKIRF